MASYSQKLIQRLTENEVEAMAEKTGKTIDELLREGVLLREDVGDKFCDIRMLHGRLEEKLSKKKNYYLFGKAALIKPHILQTGQRVVSVRWKN